MRSSGSEEPLVLIIGEAPGETEDNKGQPFLGKSGRKLRDALDALGLDIERDVRFSNVVRCRPPNNKISKRYIDLCKHYAQEEIEYYNPKLVLLMGNSPLSAILGEQGITTWNGVIAEREGRTYAPLFHPAYILRNEDAEEEWLSAFMAAVDTLTADPEEKEDRWIFPSTLEEVEQMREELKKTEFISYDVETGDLDPHSSKNKLLAVSFSNGDKAWAVPIFHNESPWDAASMQSLLNSIVGVLSDHDGYLVGHNMKFDQKHTKTCLGVDFRAGGDSMLASYMLDTRKGIHGLKRLAGAHLGMFDYDKELEDYKHLHPEADPDKGGSYANIPIKVLLPYAAMDAYATLLLERKFYQEMSDKQVDLYEEMILSASDELVQVELNGMAIDTYIAQRYVTIYQAKQLDTYEDLLTEPDVLKTVEELQEIADWKLSHEMAAKTGLSQEAVVIDGDYLVVGAGKIKSRRRRKIVQFNPASSDQVRVLYYDVCGMPVLGETETGEATTSYKVVKPLETEYPIIKKVRYYNLLNKMLGTYLEPAATGEWFSGDGRVHSNFNLNGTVTGRISSSDPNLQNIPTPEKEPGTILESLPIKNIFTHSWWKPSVNGHNHHTLNVNGHTAHGALLAIDYSGMELRVFASLAKCEPMLEIHKSGKDFHKMISTMMVYDKPDIYSITDEEYNSITKPVRYIYKWTSWTLLYGGDEHTLYRLYGIPLKEGKAAKNRYFNTFPEVPAYMNDCERFAIKNGYIESPMGRREKLFYIADNNNPSKQSNDRRAAVNMPVQSAASDTMLCAAIIISRELRRRGLRAMIVNIVHDSIVLDTPLYEVEEVAEMCTHIMENIISYAAVELPRVDFSWLLCPLKADAEIGTHYGTYIPLEEYYSNGKQLP